MEAAQPPLAGKRVLIIVENLPVPFDRRVWQEAQALHRAGALVSVICPTGKGFTAREEVIGGINIYRHRLPVDASSARGYLLEYGAALFWELRLALKVWRRHGFDVIHACNPPDLIFLVAAPFKLLGKKFIFDHHDINPELFEAKFGKRGFLWQMMRFLEWLTFKTADVSIATNNSYRDIATGRGGMPADRVFVVRSGPDLDRLKPVAPSTSWKKGRQYMVGYVGVMGSQEGIDLLLESIGHIVKREGRTDVQFCLAGGGPALDEMRQLADCMGIAEYVTFTGRIPDAELFELLSSADVCINPDRVNPMNDLSTMNKILEYMAFGKPIVQYEVKEGRYSAASASLYAKPNDPVDFAKKVLELLEKPDLRQSMGEEGRERVHAQFSWKHQVPQLVDAYQKALR